MNRFYEDYWRNTGFKHLDHFPLKWSVVQQYIPRQKSITILDFGCGNGRLIAEMKKINPNANYIGLDVAQNALEEARRHLSNVVFYKVEDGESFPIKNNSIDFIFSSEVIEHVYNTESTFSEMARVLKPGGTAFITTPYHGLIKNLLIVLFNFNKHFSPTGSHVRFFTKKTLSNLLEKHGFRIKKYGYFGRFRPVSHSIFVLARKRA